MYSPQNIDRLVTFYRAALRSDRVFVMDLYAAAITAATGRDTIPQADWDRVRVYLPRSQKHRIVETQAFERTDAVRAKRIFPEELRERRNQLVMQFRISMAKELEAAGCLDVSSLDSYSKRVVGPSDIEAYVIARRREGAANGTIRRELATLSRMLRLAYENGKLLRLPVMRKPKDGAPREGFFERDEYEAVVRHLPPDLRVAAAIAYTFGWRTQSEVLALERRQLDLDAGTLRLDPGRTKNDEGRIVYLTPELKAFLAAQVERIRAVERKTGRIIPYLFPYLSGLRLGRRRRDYRKAWTTACQKAGQPGRLRHDFRRTAVRNLVNLGVPERVAMTVTGHKSRAVFDRYHIVSPGDLRDVARRLAGTFSGTSEGFRLTPVPEPRNIPGAGG